MILITRPTNEAKLLAKALKSFSLPNTTESLTSFKYCKKRINFNENCLFIVSSLQAVHAMRMNQKDYKDIIMQGKFLVVGMKVASELKLLGVKNIVKRFNSSDSLMSYLLHEKKPFKFKVEYLCGSIINDEFVIALKRSKIKYKKNVLYKTLAAKQISSQCLDLLQKNEIKIVLIYSAYSAKVFLKLLRHHKLISVLKNINILCLSKRIAGVFQDKVPPKRLLWCRSPSQKSLLTKLESAINRI